MVINQFTSYKLHIYNEFLSGLVFWLGEEKQGEVGASELAFNLN